MRLSVFLQTFSKLLFHCDFSLIKRSSLFQDHKKNRVKLWYLLIFMKESRIFCFENWSKPSHKVSLRFYTIFILVHKYNRQAYLRLDLSIPLFFFIYIYSDSLNHFIILNFQRDLMHWVAPISQTLSSQTFWKP